MEEKKEYIEKLICLNRVTKVVKGGRRFSFAAMMVIGDQNGRVGYGFGKANDVSEAIRKSVDKARRNMIKVPLRKGTLTHEVLACFNKSEVLIKPATPGTGIIAGGPVRAIMEALGVHDVMSKSLGSQNAINTVKAVFSGLESIVDAKIVAHNRGKSLQELWG